jgi:hypothetical protein
VQRAVALKLYQPAHQRHYLVAANLVCGVPGFPDRAVATGGREQIGFVLRRLLVPNGSSTTDRAEFAFLKDTGGARWQRIDPAAGSGDPGATLVDGEELLPLFPLTFNDDRAHPRRLFAGVIPVGRREEYMTTAARADLTPPASAAPSGPGANGTDATKISARKEQLKMDVVEPWKNLARSAYAAATRLNSGTPDSGSTDPNPINTARTRFNNQLQTQSWLILLDFSDYLFQHLPDVWDAVGDPTHRSRLSDKGQRLFDWLNTAGTGQSASQIPIDGTGQRAFASSLRDALKRVRQDPATRTGLEGAVSAYPDDPNAGGAATLSWPSFLFPLASVGPNSTAPTTTAAGVHESLSAFTNISGDATDVVGSSTAASQAIVEASVALLDKLVQLVVTAIDTSKPSAPASPVPFAAKLRDALSTTQGDDGWFVLRCVYVRCDCGPLRPAVLSARSQQFQLAGFFDPDAPARPIRIALPFDTTPAGLRKFNKNTAFVMSDVLCGQVQRAKGLGFIDLVLSVLPWPLHKDLDVGGMGPCGGSNPMGMICSLSIPIITICALILLIIIVTLLDLIFRWIPFFLICFPVPKLKGKTTVPTP